MKEMTICEYCSMVVEEEIDCTAVIIWWWKEWIVYCSMAVGERGVISRQDLAKISPRPAQADAPLRKTIEKCFNNLTGDSIYIYCSVGPRFSPYHEEEDSPIFT